MNILYLTMAPIDESSGVYKKVRAQVDAFNRQGHICNLLFVRDSEDAFFYTRDGQVKLNLNVYNHIKFISEYISLCEICYVRFELLRHSNFKRVIDICKQEQIKIVTEIPTYPPYQESIARAKSSFAKHEYIRGLKTLIGAIFVIYDVYRFAYMSKLMVLVADDKKFRFTDTIRIENGIDLNRNPFQQKAINDGVVRIIAVSNFSIWNGYDRAIAGLKHYVESNPETNIELIMVGGFKEGHSLIKQTKDLGLTDYIKFTGPLSGKALDEAYSNADIALGALGNHRRKVFANSSLKAKEYASRGMFMVLSDTEGIENEIKDCSYIVKSDESPIDYNSIINWFNSIPNKEGKRLFIRKYAEEHYSWDAQLVKVLKHSQCK